MEGQAKIDALQKWRRAEDPFVYVFPSSYGPQNIDWQGLPLRPQDLKK
jgi:hypothetical protein